MAELPLPDRRSHGDHAAPRPVVTLRPLWRKRLTELITTLAVYSLPLLAVIRPWPNTNTWLRTGIAHQPVDRVLVDAGTPPTTYALLTEGGIRCSSDEGVGWSALDGDLPIERWGQIRVRTLALDPAAGGLLLIGLAGQGARDPANSAGLYVSMDRGQTWQAPSRVFAGQQVQAIVVRTLARGAYACVATNTGLYCTDLAYDLVPRARGEEWHRLDWRGSDARITTMALSYANSDVLFVGTDSLGLYVTRDAGATWSVAPLGNAGLRVNDLVSSAANADWVYAATNQGVFKSSDSGESWELLPGPPGDGSVLALAGDPRSVGVLYAGLDHGGVYLTTDGGTEWRALKDGLGDTQVRSLAVDPTNPSIVWAATQDGLMRYVHASVPQQSLAPGPEAVAPTSTEPQPPEPSTTVGPTATLTLTVTHTAIRPTTAATPAPTFTPTPSPTVPTATPTATHTPTASPTLVPPPTNTPTLAPTATDTPRPVVPTHTLVVR